MALYGLNLSLSFHNVWPTPWVTTQHEVSVEAAAVVLILSLLAYWGPPISRRGLTALAVVMTLLVIGRYADVTAPALYGRAIDLYWDSQHLPGVAAMLFTASPSWFGPLVVLSVLALLMGLFLVLRWMLGLIADAVALPGPRRVYTGLGASMVALFVIGHMEPRASTLGWFALPVSATYAEQLSFLRRALDEEAPMAALDAPPLPASDLQRVAGADVLLVFLESYGATTFDHTEYARALAPSRAALARAVDASGRGVVSAYVRSPTHGGASWLSHASLLSGIDVHEHRLYRLLLTRDRETLVHRFAREGYRTVALMPGLQQAWPEGSFYGFDHIYDAADLEYQGPAFGWWRIPDQYALARVDAAELSADGRAPVMLVFATISSHLPFRPTPPYQPDWRTLLERQAFEGDGVTEALSQVPDWTHLGPAYVDSVAYALTYLAGYLTERGPADLVLIVVGDHQPAASVSGEGAPWDVPVHIVSARPALMDALVTAGFEPGLEPRRPVLGRMHALSSILLDAFDSGPGGDGRAGLSAAATEGAASEVPSGATQQGQNEAMGQGEREGEDAQDQRRIVHVGR